MPYNVDNNHPDSKQNFEEYFYFNALEKFVATGEVIELNVGDALYDYLVSVMSDSVLKAQVLGSEVCARLFLDNMMRFVDAALKRKKFDINRKQAEMKGMRETLEWSPKHKVDGNQALLDSLDTAYSKYGFRSAFYRNQFATKDGLADDALWESLFQDYNTALNEYFRQSQQEDIKQRSETNKKRIENQMTAVPNYLSSHGVESDDFMQAWGMMGGEWNEYDFERLLKLVRLQRDYPVLTELANRMGRVLNPEGKTSIYAGFGSTSKMKHSSKSDIQGVSIGNDLGALLPLEMVEMVDDELNELFAYKYATKSLQTFQHRSDVLKPSRHMERRRAKQCGPMIVAIDTSGSMQGKAHNIARSMLLKLIEMCRRKKRDMYVIAFSVSARPIDVNRDQVRLMDFFSHESTGDTNATKMLEQTFELLEESSTYMSADVLIISDFHLPLVPTPLLDRITKHRTMGTYFYGLQIGECNTNRWIPFLDNLYKVGWVGNRRF